MKSMRSLALILCIWLVCSVSSAWAQQKHRPRLHRPSIDGLRTLNVGPRSLTQTSSASLNAYRSANHDKKVWELGTYPGGTWVWLSDINDFGVALGFGDVGGGLYHTLIVPLFGPHAGEWTDLGTLGGELAGYNDEPIMKISNTGLVATHSALPDGRWHAAAWTAKSGMVDLGTLADHGYPTYNASFAAAVNKFGTLIVGWSGVEQSCFPCSPTLPVVWTPTKIWKNGHFTLQWEIQKLDTAGFDDFHRWYAWDVNDLGQILGVAFNEDQSVVLPALWNPLPSGKGWKLSLLPSNPDYPQSYPFGMNNRGEIVGEIDSLDGTTWLPAFWKPLDRQGKIHAKPVPLPTPEGLPAGYADGINDVGDMTGECWGDAGDHAVRWTNRNLNFTETLDIPGDWDWVWKVNNFGIAAGVYGGGTCTQEMCGVAVQVH